MALLESYFKILPLGLLQSHHQNPILVVQEEVASICGVTIAELIADGRKQEISDIRKLAMYICLRWRLGSSTRVGEEFGGREHASILLAANRFEDLLAIEKVKWEGRITLCLQRLAARCVSTSVRASLQNV